MSSKKPKEPTEDVSWRTQIEDAVLDDDIWHVKVILIEVAGSDQDKLYLEKFEAFATQEKRFVIKNICQAETIFMINQLGSDKKVKDGNFRIFEEAQKFLSDKKDIPPEILALIIKRLILQMREEYLFIQRQRLQVKEGMRRESATMVDKTEVRGTVYVPPPEPPEPPPPPKGKGKGKGEPEPSNEPALPEDKKYNTLLRVRGEEWRDKVYVDDFPTDGPNIYVAVTGFRDPYLPAELVKIGIPLTAIVQVRIDITAHKIPSGLIKGNRRGQSQTELFAETAFKYWEALQTLRIHPDFAETFVDTAFIVYSPPYSDAESLSGNPEQIYDELCFLMYDIQDLSRQHAHYLDNMNIIKIPEVMRDERYKKHYHALVNDLPLECATIYSILDSMLQIACKHSKFAEDSNSESTLSTAVTINNMPQLNKPEETRVDKTDNLIKNIFSTLCKTEANKKSYRLTYGEEYETYPKDPLVINYGDLVKYNTFHLGNINLDSIVLASLLYMPVNNLWLGQNRPTEEFEAKINYHVNVLLSCFDREDIETSELNRLIHILACRKLYNNRSSLKKLHLLPSSISEFKKNYLKRSVLAQPLAKCPSLSRHWSSATPSFPSISKIDNILSSSCETGPESQKSNLFDCPDISELVSAAEIANFQPMSHMIDDFDLFEDFFGTSAFQIMFEAFTKFNCVDYKYCEVTDCLILMFFNSHDEDGIAREEWRSHLATPLCLQDFFDFILDEHYDWIKNEEKIYDDNMTLKSQSESKDIIDPNSLKTCIDDTDVETDLLMEGSLKYQEIQKLEEDVDDDVDPVLPGMSKSGTSIGTTTKTANTKSQPATSPKNIKHLILDKSESEESIDVVEKVFSGYDLGNRRVEVFGKDATYFSKDGTKVSSYYTLIIPMNLEYIILNVMPGNSYNEFWIHKALGERVNQKVKDCCESFRISTKDQVMINIRKQTYQVPIESTASGSDNLEKTTKPSDVNISASTAKIFETKYFYSFVITWPNGMITESVYEDNSPTISHIKQYFIDPRQDNNEEIRCISLNGEVIIFKTSGNIEVLKPDGSYICITKYGKRVVIPKPPDEPIIEDISDKGKKGKTKPLKEKSSKASSRSSKNALIEEILLSKLEYELIIEEFETIETSGLRQKWINDESFNIEKLLIRTATDFCLGEIFSRRMDGSSTLLNKDGLLVVTFPNKTRIITCYEIEEDEILPEWTDEERVCFNLIDSSSIEVVKSHISQSSFVAYTNNTESTSSFTSKKHEEDEKFDSDGFVSIQLIYIIEHANFSTVKINKSTKKISVDSPNDTTVTIDQNNHYEIILDTETTAKFNGEDINISYEACPECKAFTNCNIKIKSEVEDPVTDNVQHWLKMKDSFCKKIYVDEEGNINLNDDTSTSEMIINPEDMAENADTTITLAETNAEEKTTDLKSESSYTSHGKCREIYSAKTIKLFVLKRDLTCAELVHRALIEQYKSNCRWQPWCSINQYNTFCDNRSLITILTPVHLTESEKWLMNSKIADKPKYLTYKDLKPDCGKGFYHWMRPYDSFVTKPMKPDTVLPPRLPRAFILRSLEQQWSESTKQDFKGARELIMAILRYRCIMEADRETLMHIPIADIRSSDEKRIDDIIQTLAHKVYMDLKARLAEDAQSRAKAAITTTLLPEPEMSYDGQEHEQELEGSVFKHVDEEREEQLKQADASGETSPSLQRYWRRRAEEYKEEQFYKYLLRESNVPPYFKNVLGGAIWWDLNHLTGEAITKAERRRMKCVCAVEEQAESNSDYCFQPPQI